jgi:ribosomal protein S12 methylthiotransferase
VKEISLIAQETTYYGVDLYGKPTLSKLIERLEQIDGIEWIRLMYTYPLLFDDNLIAHFGAGGKLLPYLDIPLQHCNDEILSQMKRVVTRKQTEQLLQRLRESSNDLVLRTSLIVGFPGETDTMFNELTEFVKKWKFERAGIFRFSSEDGTAASKLDNKVPQKVINQRYNELEKVQQELTKRYARQQIGKQIAVIIDAPFEETNGKIVADCFIGRAKSDAPDIDPYIIVGGQTEVGRIEKCEVVEVSGNNLVAVI